MKKFVFEGKSFRTVGTMGVLRTFREIAGYDISEWVEKKDSAAPAIFLWASIKTAARIDGNQFDISLDDFCDRVGIQETNEWFLTNFVGKPETDKKK